MGRESNLEGLSGGVCFGPHMNMHKPFAHLTVILDISVNISHPVIA